MSEYLKTQRQLCPHICFADNDLKNVRFIVSKGKATIPEQGLHSQNYFSNEPVWVVLITLKNYL